MQRSNVELPSTYGSRWNRFLFGRTLRQVHQSLPALLQWGCARPTLPGPTELTSRRGDRKQENASAVQDRTKSRRCTPGGFHFSKVGSPPPAPPVAYHATSGGSTARPHKSLPPPALLVNGPEDAPQQQKGACVRGSKTRPGAIPRREFRAFSYADPTATRRQARHRGRPRVAKHVLHPPKNYDTRPWCGSIRH